MADQNKIATTLAGRETRLIARPAKARRTCGEKQTAPTTTTSTVTNKTESRPSNDRLL
jgi:hypothetical protein